MAAAPVNPSTAVTIPASEPAALVSLAAQGAKQGAAFASLRTALAAGARARGMHLDEYALNLLTAAAAMVVHAAGNYGERPKLVTFGELALVGAASHGITDIFGMLEEMVMPLINDVEHGKTVVSGVDT